jgi:hypothetical protein
LNWPDDNGKPPVDWRYWVALYNFGFKFKKIKYVGEEAFFPGSWRDGLTMKQALTCVEGVMNKKRVVYVKNISRQVQKVKPDGINEIRIAPGERIEWEKASYMGPNGIRMLAPGFTYDSQCVVPMLVKETEKPKKELTEKEVKKWMEEMQPKKEPLAMGEVTIDLVQEASEKTPFDDIRMKVATVSPVEEIQKGLAALHEKTTVIDQVVDTLIPVDPPKKELNTTMEGCVDEHGNYSLETMVHEPEKVEPEVIEEEKKPKRRSTRTYTRKRKT